MAVRVLAVADSHLSDRTPDAVDNWRAVLAHAAATRPDLVVHLGDASLDGVAAPEELELTAGWLGRLEPRWRVVPGNHDVGDRPTPDGEDRWEAVFGPGRWVERLGRWVVVGLDAQLLGSGLAAEAGQWEWLAATVGALDPGTPTLLALHKPVLDHDDGTSGTTSPRYVPPDSALRLARMWSDRPAPVTLSGHVHQHRDLTHDGRRHLWAPSTWVTFPDDRQRRVGTKRTGVLELELGDDGAVTARVLRPEGWADLVLGVTTPDPFD